MKIDFTKFKRFYKQLRGFFPSALPVGMTEFESWAKSFMDTYTLPTDNEDSIKYTLATIIMHLGPQVAYKPKYFFYLTMKASAAKQIAGANFYAIKEKQKQAEATARAQAVADGPQQ